MVGKCLWDFCSGRQENLIQRWARDERLTSAERALLNQRLDRLAQLDFEQAIHSNLLNGPIYKERHIYKLKVNGDKILRPMLCRGPLEGEKERAYTLLIGACEDQGKFIPDKAPQRAEERRQDVLRDPKNKRLNHERF